MRPPGNRCPQWLLATKLFNRPTVYLSLPYKFFGAVNVHEYKFAPYRMLNLSAHTKHFIFHAFRSTASLNVCFDLFRYLSRRTC